jgi:hypothetical protein
MELLADLRVRVAACSPAAAAAGWYLRQFGARIEMHAALDPEGLGAFFAEGATFDPAPDLVASPGELVITDAPVTDTTRARLEALARDHRVTWITPFGLNNTWERAPSTSLTRYAAGGWMPHVGDPAREPLAPPGSQDLVIAGLWAALAGPAPLLGQHTREVLAGLGLDDAAIRALEADGVTGSSPVQRTRA